jgi:cullin-associated NEDD8-dissociated protein 1
LDLENFVEFLEKMIEDIDIYVRRYALESLTAITYARSEVVLSYSQSIIKKAITMTEID